MNHPPVRYLILWLTTACNLHCRYCYRKEEKSLAMPQDVASAALALAASSGVPFHVQLAGGEPTLEPGLIEFVGHIVRTAGWPVTLAVQTNGTLVDRHLIDLCQRYDIGIGVSLDGPPEVQEELRGMSGATFRGLTLLEEAAIPVRVTTVLSSVNAERLHDLALTLARFQNIRGVGLDPVVMTGSTAKRHDLLPSSEAVTLGVKTFFEAMEWINRIHGARMQWRELEAVQKALSDGGVPRPYCHACTGESLGVHPDGTVYPCGQTVGDPAMAAGTVDSADRARLRTCYQGMELHGDCAGCPLAGRCPGDCPSRLRYSGNDGGTPVMCAIYRTIAEMLMERRAGLSRKEIKKERSLAADNYG
ncbi:MAG: hypothetical protein A4E57_03477 [Syntrophorhabdaceae bacterium PtaU1.Bin034]|nr:MAG: hypothetical protein A4E57_03477 [Syntrophorhabdaceae bacterium PtaU1.Bin034]